jgi:hypothetical protein
MRARSHYRHGRGKSSSEFATGPGAKKSKDREHSMACKLQMGAWMSADYLQGIRVCGNISYAISSLCVFAFMRIGTHQSYFAIKIQ